jgi:hypothetical protein
MQGHPKKFSGSPGGGSDPHLLEGSKGEVESRAAYPKDTPLELTADEIPKMAELFARQPLSSIQPWR